MMIMLGSLNSKKESKMAVAKGFPGGSDGKAPVCNAGDPSSIPGSGRPPGEGNGNPPQYSHLENPMDRGAWLATVHGVAKSWQRLSQNWARASLLFMSFGLACPHASRMYFPLLCK